MSSLFGILSLMVSSVLFAWKPHSVNEIKVFLSKKERCVFAVAINKLGNELGTQNGLPLLHPGSILCVNDMSSGEGTIREQKGCGFAFYDVETDQYKPTYSVKIEHPNKTQGREFSVVQGVSCSEGGFEKLLTVFAGSAYSEETVKGAILSGYGGGAKPYTVFVYSDESKYQNWWETNKRQSKERKK